MPVMKSFRHVSSELQAGGSSGGDKRTIEVNCKDGTRTVIQLGVHTKRSSAIAWPVDEADRLRANRVKHHPSGLLRSIKKNNNLHLVNQALLRAQDNVNITKNVGEKVAFGVDLGVFEQSLLQASITLNKQVMRRTKSVRSSVDLPILKLVTLRGLSMMSCSHVLCEKRLKGIERSLVSNRGRTSFISSIERDPVLYSLFQSVEALTQLLRRGDSIKLGHREQVEAHITDLQEVAAQLYRDGKAYINQRREIMIWRDEATRRDAEIAKILNKSQLISSPGPISGTLVRHFPIS